MWPFNKSKVKTFKEYASERVESACGDNEVHYEWSIMPEENSCCPICSANMMKRKERSEHEEMAELIADKVYEKLIQAKEADEWLKYQNANIK